MIHPTAMYCRACHYDLRASQRECRCPECGAEFHPLDPTSYSAEVPRPRRWSESLNRWAWVLLIGTAAGLAVQFLAAVMYGGH